MFTAGQRLGSVDTDEGTDWVLVVAEWVTEAAGSAVAEGWFWFR